MAASVLTYVAEEKDKEIESNDMKELERNSSSSSAFHRVDVASQLSVLRRAFGVSPPAFVKDVIQSSDGLSDSFLLNVLSEGSKRLKSGWRKKFSFGVYGTIEGQENARNSVTIRQVDWRDENDSIHSDANVVYYNDDALKQLTHSSFYSSPPHHSLLFVSVYSPSFFWSLTLRYHRLSTTTEKSWDQLFASLLMQQQSNSPRAAVSITVPVPQHAHSYTPAANSSVSSSAAANLAKLRLMVDAAAAPKPTDLPRVDSDGVDDDMARSHSAANDLCSASPHSSNGSPSSALTSNSNSSWKATAAAEEVNSEVGKTIEERKTGSAALVSSTGATNSSSSSSSSSTTSSSPSSSTPLSSSTIAPSIPQGVCKYFIRGRPCLRGMKCTYKHSIPGSADPATPKQPRMPNNNVPSIFSIPLHSNPLNAPVLANTSHSQVIPLILPSSMAAQYATSSSTPNSATGNSSNGNASASGGGAVTSDKDSSKVMYAHTSRGDYEFGGDDRFHRANERRAANVNTASATGSGTGSGVNTAANSSGSSARSAGSEPLRASPEQEVVSVRMQRSGAINQSQNQTQMNTQKTKFVKKSYQSTTPQSQSHSLQQNSVMVNVDAERGSQLDTSPLSSPSSKSDAFFDQTAVRTYTPSPALNYLPANSTNGAANGNVTTNPMSNSGIQPSAAFASSGVTPRTIPPRARRKDSNLSLSPPPQSTTLSAAPSVGSNSQSALNTNSLLSHAAMSMSMATVTDEDEVDERHSHSQSHTPTQMHRFVPQMSANGQAAAGHHIPQLPARQRSPPSSARQYMPANGGVGGGGLGSGGTGVGSSIQQRGEARRSSFNNSKYDRPNSIINVVPISRPLHVATGSSPGSNSTLSSPSQYSSPSSHWTNLSNSAAASSVNSFPFNPPSQASSVLSSPRTSFSSISSHSSQSSPRYVLNNTPPVPLSANANSHSFHNSNSAATNLVSSHSVHNNSNSNTAYIVDAHGATVSHHSTSPAPALSMHAKVSNQTQLQSQSQSQSQWLSALQQRDSISSNVSHTNVVAAGRGDRSDSNLSNAMSQSQLSHISQTQLTDSFNQSYSQFTQFLPSTTPSVPVRSINNYGDEYSTQGVDEMAVAISGMDLNDGRMIQRQRSEEVVLSRSNSSAANSYHQIQSQPPSAFHTSLQQADMQMQRSPSFVIEGGSSLSAFQNNQDINHATFAYDSHLDRDRDTAQHLHGIYPASAEVPSHTATFDSISSSASSLAAIRHPSSTPHLLSHYVADESPRVSMSNAASAAATASSEPYHSTSLYSDSSYFDAVVTAPNPRYAHQQNHGLQQHSNSNPHSANSTPTLNSFHSNSSHNYAHMHHDQTLPQTRPHSSNYHHPPSAYLPQSSNAMNSASAAGIHQSTQLSTSGFPANRLPMSTLHEEPNNPTMELHSHSISHTQSRTQSPSAHTHSLMLSGSNSNSSISNMTVSHSLSPHMHSHALNLNHTSHSQSPMHGYSHSLSHSQVQSHAHVHSHSHSHSALNSISESALLTSSLSPVLSTNTLAHSQSHSHTMSQPLGDNSKFVSRPIYNS